MLMQNDDFESVLENGISRADIMNRSLKARSGVGAWAPGS